MKARPISKSIITVVSPITSLMKDQVSNCRSKGLSAVAVTRDKSKEECEDVIEGKYYQIVYYATW